MSLDHKTVHAEKPKLASVIGKERCHVEHQRIEAKRHY